MTKEEFLNLYYTMPFAKDTPKSAARLNENTLYIVSFNGPDLIFHFVSMDEWSLQTATNYFKERENDGFKFKCDQNHFECGQKLDSST